MTSSIIYQLFICGIFLLVLFVISKVVTHKNLIFKIKESKKNFEIKDKQYIGKNSMLVTVKIHDETLLLGVTSQQINLIKKIDDQPIYEN